MNSTARRRLVVLQPDNYEFSWPVSVQGCVPAPVKVTAVHCGPRLALNADRPTLRALLWRCVAAFPCLPRVMAIACARHLAAQHRRNAGPAIIKLKDH